MAEPQALAIENLVTYAVDASRTIPVNGLVYLETDDVRPAASQSDQLTEVENQRVFASKFAGVAKDARVSAQLAGSLAVARIWEGVMDCASATWEVGDLIGASEASGGTSLENRVVEKVTDPTLAIGYCLKREGSATTRVTCRLESRVARMPAAVSSVTRQIGTRAKVGATAGFVVGAATNSAVVATCPASQTNATLVIPIDGLRIGEVITGLRYVAQVESAGGTVTTLVQLYATVNVAADVTESEIVPAVAFGSFAVVADTAQSQLQTGYREVVTSGKSYYLLITATTAAATDIAVQHCEITTNGAQAVA